MQIVFVDQFFFTEGIYPTFNIATNAAQTKRGRLIAYPFNPK